MSRNSKIRAHFFDMDHTLIDADCDVTWKEFMIAEKLAPESAREQAEKFFEDYNLGRLDFEAFTRFQLAEFAGRTEAEMAELCRRHFQQFIKTRIYPAAFELVREVVESGVPAILLTSTNLTIAGPVADFFGIRERLGTRLEIQSGRYTGRITGIYGAGEGKVQLAAEYCRARHWELSEIAYYGDSINDRNILEASGHPFAVNPSPALAALAQEKHWPVLDFRRQEQPS